MSEELENDIQCLHVLYKGNQKHILSSLERRGYIMENPAIVPYIDWLDSCAEALAQSLYYGEA